jgi:secreted trypsin-like serine protease
LLITLLVFHWTACGVPVGGSGEEGDKVVNGSEVFIADHPWAVMLHVSGDESSSTSNCAGTLISPRMVLTAGHCLRGRRKEDVRVVAAEDFSLGLEAWDVRLLEVADWKIHEDYEREGEATDPVHDLALVWLAEDAPEGSEPARLWQGTTPPDAARVLGWGRTETGATSTSLRAKEVSVLAVEDAPLSTRLRERWKNLLVTEGDDGGFCQGDSGGPLESLDERGVLLGVLSRTANAGPEGERLAPCHVGAAVPSGVAIEWLRSIGVSLDE